MLQVSAPKEEIAEFKKIGSVITNAEKSTLQGNYVYSMFLFTLFIKNNEHRIHYIHNISKQFIESNVHFQLIHK